LAKIRLKSQTPLAVLGTMKLQLQVRETVSELPQNGTDKKQQYDLNAKSNGKCRKNAQYNRNVT
jgi:hypothetical protein